MNDTIAITVPTPAAPKFRSTARLVQWVRRRKIDARLPAESERCFFRTKEAPEKVAVNVVNYAQRVGELGPELESLLDESNATAYCRILCRRNVKPSLFVLNKIVRENLLVHLAQSHGKFPHEVERRILDPKSMAEYATTIREPLEENLEAVILQDGDAVMKYLDVLPTNTEGVPEKFLRALVGCDRHFVNLSNKFVRGRLPSYLEESIGNPEVALNYARHILKGRLPSEVELVLQKDARCAVRYAFEVIRGFASPLLPELLHTAVIMHSCGNPQDSEIRRYIAEIERTSK